MTRFVSAWAGIEDTAHVAVTASGRTADRVAAHLEALVADGVASGIAAQDPTLWGPAAVEESSKRLGWTALHETTKGILPQLKKLCEEADAEGLTRVVLCGMGGSSLGPEVIARTHGVPLVVLDSTDPGQVRRALEGDLESTIVVVSSKSGSTVETDSQRRSFEVAFAAAGLDYKRHMVIVTDPGSPLEHDSRIAGYREVFLADPNVGGRFSVLSAFGVVPSALAGVDVEEMLLEAAVVAPSLAEDSPANPALVLGAALYPADGAATVVIRDDGSGIVGLGDWAEQLVAESTGKEGVGVLPVVAGSGAPEVGASDVIDLRLVTLDSEDEAGDISVAGTLGAQFLIWEYATAIVSRLMSINPFDQPNVETAKKAARAMLDSVPEPEAPALVDGGIEIRATEGLLGSATSVEDAITALLGTLGPRGYLALMAYLDREKYASLAEVREPLAARTGRPVTFGWGPRFLHSTGQLHKGGELVGAFLQITGVLAPDLEVPGKPYGYRQLILSQAGGDAKVLADAGRPVLRLHLTDPSQVARVRAALGA